MQGKIIKGIAGFYYIYAENDEIYECKAKGIFRKDKQKPLVGDNVEIEVLDEQEKEGSVTAILPRKNSLIRPAVANVDQAFVIFAMENPKPNFMLLDRFLIMMEKENVPAVICFNKKDLAKQEELELLYETYKSCGYDVIFSSTFNGEGLDEIREILKGKTTVVGKLFCVIYKIWERVIWIFTIFIREKNLKHMSIWELMYGKAALLFVPLHQRRRVYL